MLNWAHCILICLTCRRAVMWHDLGCYCLWTKLTFIFMLMNMINARCAGEHDSTGINNLQDSCNMAQSWMVSLLGRINPHIHACEGHNYFQMSSLTWQLNSDWVLIDQTYRIAAIWHILTRYCMWAELTFIFMLIKDMILHCLTLFQSRGPFTNMDSL